MKALRGLREFFRNLGQFRRTVIGKLLGEQWRWLIIVLACSLLSFGAIITYANSIRDAIDNAIVEQHKPLGPFITTMVVAALAAFVFSLALRQATSRIGFHIEYQVRVRLYDQLMSLRPRTLDRLATGQVTTRAVTDLHFLEIFVQYIPTLAVTVILVSALAVIILVQNVPMAILAIGSVPVNAWLVMKIRYRLLGLSWMGLNRRAEVTTTIDEAVRGIRVVKTFGREEHERGRVRDRAESAYAVGVSRVRLLARYDFMLRGLPAIFTAAEIILAGRLISGGGYTIGRLLVLLYFATVLTQFAQTFADIANIWQLARAGALRITELLDQIPDEPPTDSVALPDPSTGLRLRGVGFTDGDEEKLSGLDIDVAPGSLVVLHGGPGSGKSLTAALAAGRVAPTAGTVVLDGVDLQALDPLAVTKAVHVLTEEPFLFARPVRENLMMGAAELPGGAITDDDLWAALRAAGADQFVTDLEDGIETVIGDRGMTLSGGQRQRLALARALVLPPRVLVFDDALAAVNPALELEIVDRIRSRAPNMAVLCITRREGLATRADAVVTLPERGGRSHVEQVEVATSTEASMLQATLTAFGGELPPQLMTAIATLPPETDKPPVREEEATAADERPRVLGILRTLRWPVALAFGFLLLYTIVNLVGPGLFKLAVDDFEKGTHGTADRVAVAIALLSVLTGAANFAFRLTAVRVTEGALYLMRRRVFQRLSRLGVDYYDRELPGQVAARVVYDLDRVAEFLDHQGIYYLTVFSAVLFSGMGVILVWSPAVAANVLPFVPIMLVASFAQIPLADRAYDRQRAKLGAVVERLQEDIAGRYVLDAFGARGEAKEEFHSRAWELRLARRWATLVSNTYTEIMNTLGNLAGAALIATAGALAIAGSLSVGSMIALELYLLTALAPIVFLAEAMQKLMKARASFRALRRPWSAPILPVERAGATPCPSLRGEVAFDAVQFGYPGTGRTVLHDVSITLPARSSVALVGPTGAGKTSVAKLVLRIYDPDDGTVRVDGIDLRDVDLTSYRRRLGAVPQDAFCFRGTVRDNVAYGRPDASADEVRAAIRAAQGERLLLSLPGGISAIVDEEGRNLTAAQRQLIALARALLVEPDILILDEATSSLDTSTEEAVLDAVAGLDRTTVFITHRLPVARRADRVVLVDDGRVVEAGSHDELLARGGAYARLWTIGPDLDEPSVVPAPV